MELETELTEGISHVETNRNIQWNLGTFNVPTLVGLATIGVMIFNAGQKIQQQDSRITNIEDSRTESRLQAAKVVDLVSSNTASIANLTYRLTVAEQGIINTNARLDRQTDSIQDFRSDLAKVNTSIELLSQQIKILLPEKKAEIRSTLPELASR